MAFSQHTTDNVMPITVKELPELAEYSGLVLHGGTIAAHASFLPTESAHEQAKSPCRRIDL